MGDVVVFGCAVLLDFVYQIGRSAYTPHGIDVRLVRSGHGKRVFRLAAFDIERLLHCAGLVHRGRRCISAGKTWPQGMTSALTTSYEDVLILLGNLAEYVNDPAISEVMVNPNGTVFVEQRGIKRRVHIDVHIPNLIAAGIRIANYNNDKISSDKAVFNGRLGDGSSRVCIVVPPASPDGPMWSIRKFPKTKLRGEDLIELGSIGREAYEYLRTAVKNRETILMSGGPGTGKTTLLQILAADINIDDRIALIEKPSEIQLDHVDLVRLEAADFKGVSMKLLIETVLRLLPTRVIFGEVRGGEAADLLEVLNTGHPGSFTTIHANSARLALSRLTTLALGGGAEYVPTRRIIGDVVRHVVHLRVLPTGKRLVSEIIRVSGYRAATDEFVMDQVFSKEES